MNTGIDARTAVHQAAVAATAAATALQSAPQDQIRRVLQTLGRNLSDHRPALLEANREDVRKAVAAGLSPGMLDRLAIDGQRLSDMARQLDVLAALEVKPAVRPIRSLDDDTVVLEKRRPIGVLGANFEARPGVTVDMASQSLFSRNACVLRTGSAALITAQALVDLAIGPALEDTGLPRDAVRLLQSPDRDGAEALVQLPEHIPVVILRGSGESTRSLGRLAAGTGVYALAHADGGGVLYVHADADADVVTRLVDEGTDRLGVCNRLNLLLVDSSRWDDVVPRVQSQLAGREHPIAVSIPPLNHPVGYEWALDDARAATITAVPVEGPLDAAATANRETSGLAASIATQNDQAADQFVGAYAGTGVFVNRTTRLLDGYRLLGVPETGINVGPGPGPRGPVTFRDLFVRQYLVVPSAQAARLTAVTSVH